MNNIKTVSFIAILILLASCLNYAFAGEQEIKSDIDRDIRKEYKAFKDHHLKDIHSFKLFKYKKEDKNNIYFFSSSYNYLLPGRIRCFHVFKILQLQKQKS